MGGAVQGIGQAIGVDKKPSAPQQQPQQAAAPIERAGIEKATSSQELQASKMRSARRRGRSLLSDARLNAESGIQILGGGDSLAS